MVLDGFSMFKQGAEGRLYRGIYLGKPSIIKERFSKKYRHPTLDEQLNRERLKAEGRALVRSKMSAVRSPAVYLVDFERKIIVMEDVENSVTAKDYINKALEGKCTEKLELLEQQIGEAISKLHKDNIIHGDLTTSNMLIVDDNNLKLYMIDFGLSHSSYSAEDKAVDLYVLERAILSTHSNSEDIFNKILEAYKSYNNKGFKEVFVKLEEVRSRGRKRTMVG